MDSSFVPGDTSSFSEADNERISKMIDQFQARDSLKTYNMLVERCFNDCVHSFYRKSLGKQEENCVRHCVEKFLRHSMRVSVQFAELTQAQQDAFHA